MPKILGSGKNPSSTALSTFFLRSSRNITDEACIWFNPNFVILIQSSSFLIILKSIIIYNFNFSSLEKFCYEAHTGYSFLASVPSHIDTHVSQTHLRKLSVPFLSLPLSSFRVKLCFSRLH